MVSPQEACSPRMVEQRCSVSIGNELLLASYSPVHIRFPSRTRATNRQVLHYQYITLPKNLQYAGFLALPRMNSPILLSHSSYFYYTTKKPPHHYTKPDSCVVAEAICPILRCYQVSPRSLRPIVLGHFDLNATVHPASCDYPHCLGQPLSCTSIISQKDLAEAKS